MDDCGNVTWFCFAESESLELRLSQEEGDLRISSRIPEPNMALPS
jgi:hypothetical protein